MKTYRLSFCLLLALVGVGAFTLRLQAEGLPDNIPTDPDGNHQYDYYYWSPRTGATVNSWNMTDPNWMLNYAHFNFTPGLKWAYLNENNPAATPVYAVFWDETNVGAANTYKTVDLDVSIVAKGLHFRNQGWNIQAADHASTLTLISGNPTVPSGVDDRQAITMDTGSQATISANVILGAFPGSSANSDGTNQYIDMEVNSALTISGNISESGAAKILNIGLGSLPAGAGSALTLSGTNTFTGGVVLATGTTAYGVNTTARLNLNSTQALGTGSLTIAGGAGIMGNTSGTAVSVANAYVFTNAAGTAGNYLVGTTQPVETESLVFAGADNLTLTADHALTANRAFGVENSGGALILAGRISGTGSLLKNLAGTLRLTATDNTYTGMTVINGGVLEVAHLANGGQASSIGASNSTTLRSNSAFTVTNMSASGTATPLDNNTPIPTLVLGGGGTLRYTGTGDSTDRLIGMLAGQTNFTDAVIPVSIDASGSGALKFTSTASVVQINLPAQSRNLILTGTNTGDNTFSLAFADSRNAGINRGNNQLTKNGTGTWIVTGNNTHTGGTTVNEGLLVLTGTNTTDAPTTNTAPNGTSSAGPGKFTVNGGTLQFAKTASFYNSVVDATNAARLTVASGATTAFNVGGTGEFTSAHLDTLLVSGGFASGSFLGVDTTNASGGTFAYASNISGSIGLRKLGSGTLVLSGVNTYTGPTTITGGTLAKAGNTALGSGTVVVAGGVFLIESGLTGTNNAVTLSGGEYDRTLTNSADLKDAVNSTSSFATGQPDTTAKILQGTLTSGTTLQTGFANTSTALNDEIRLSDVYSFRGTNTDVFVLQLTMTGVTADSMLGWLNGSNEWVNAVLGNTGPNNILFVNGGYDGNLVLGHYGVDVATGSVWAVINHNSDFAVVPEPSTLALLGMGTLGLLALRRKLSAPRRI